MNTETKTSLIIPETEIARLVVARTFLGELEECVTDQYYRHPLSGNNKEANEIFSRKFSFIDQLVPVAWHYAAKMAEDFIPADFKAKLADPANADHNRQHLGHVGNNVIVGASYDLELPGFTPTEAKDAAMALMAAAFIHDHLQIDAGIKPGHDHIGGLFIKGLMRFARLKHRLPFNERQENLAFYSVYWHSYPEKKVGNLPSARDLIDHYGEQFGLNNQNSLLYWLTHELNQLGVDINSLDCHLSGGDLRLAKWVNHRLVAGDKRASYAPPFLSVLRTMGTGDKPFLDPSLIGRPLKFFEENIKNESVVTRTLFEDRRNLRDVGFSAFELNWLKFNQVRKLDYLVMMAEVLATGGNEFITGKFSKYAEKVITESWRKQTLDPAGRHYLLAALPRLFSGMNLSSLAQFSPDLVNTIEIIILEHENAMKLLGNKGQELRKIMIDRKWPIDKFMTWFSDLTGQIKETSQYQVVGRHGKIPENLPVYCTSLGVIK